MRSNSRYPRVNLHFALLPTVPGCDLSATSNRHVVTRYSLIILLVLTSMPRMAIAQDAASSFDPQLAVALQDELDAQRVKWNVPGVSAAVIVGGQGLWTGAAGFDGPRSSEPITSDMLFGMASITKTVTATTILLLAEEGRLGLDDRLGDWAPPLRHVDPETTIRQALNHTSGINNHTDHYLFWDSLAANPNRVWKPVEIFDRFVGLPFWAPGTAYRYSNSNYLILGMIIEAAAGPVAPAIRERIWRPLGLEAMYLSTEEETEGRRATGWADLDGDGSPDDASGWYAPALKTASWTGGAMFSTAEDLARFGEALFAGRVLAPGSMEQMQTFVDNGANGYGLGVIRYRPFGIDFVGHAGNTIGYSSFMVCSDEAEICVATLINQTGRPAHEFAFALIGAVLVFRETTTEAEPDRYEPARIDEPVMYPNPASATKPAILRFALKASVRTQVTLYDILGRTVASYDLGVPAPGSHEIPLSLSGLPAGAYLYRIDSGITSFSGSLLVAE